MGDLRHNVNNANVEDAPFPLTDTDKFVLSLTDEEYQYHDWDELKEIIGWSMFSTHIYSIDQG